MKRMTVAAAVTAFTLCGVTIAVAGAIEDRQELMKSFGPVTKEAIGYARGATPFDAAKVKAIMQVYLDAADKMPKLFPAAPKPDDKTKAAPKIWEDAAGFKAEIVKFDSDAKAAAAATDQASFQTAFSKVTADCSSCHGDYRIK